MNDATNLVEAYLDGARKGHAPNLLIHGEVLYFHGWWQAAFRLADDAYIVRAEAPPAPTDVVELLHAGLADRGLRSIPGEHPLVHAVTFTELDLAAVEWTLWAPGTERGETALAARAAPEVAAGGSAPRVDDHPALGDLSAEFARSLAEGMPVSVVLAVGLDDRTVAGLEAAVPAARVQTASLDEAVATCGVTVPHLVIVDASSDEGRRFLLEFRAEACGRHVPVAAVTDGAAPPGADATLDAQAPPAAWQAQLVALLP